MSTLVEERTAGGVILPTSADLRLSESAGITEGAVQADGSILLHLIRPCVGRGRGKHLYTPGMLEANAKKFTGWRMYVNHLSEAARRALGGLPRDVREVGGIIDEAWWDGSVPAEGRFGAGAVVGRAKPIKLIRDLIDLDPRLVECSINATATNVVRQKIGTEQVWMVEGIQNDPPGSVDWVTEAGAGGQVSSLMESVYDAEDPVGAYLDTLSFDDLLAHLAESGELKEAASRKQKPKPPAADGDGDENADDEPDDDSAGDADEAKFEAAVKKFMDKGMPRAAAEKAARTAVGESQEGVDVPELTPEAIREALASDEGQAAITAAVKASMQELDLGSRVESIVETRLDEERDRLRDETETRANRRTELYEMRDYAQERVRGTKLTPKLQESILRNFCIVEGKPSPGLDIIADVDDHGTVTKTAREKLNEAIDAAVKDGYEILAEANPARVRGQGPRIQEAELDSEGKPKEPTAEDKYGASSVQLLREAGIKDPAAAFAITPESVLARQGQRG